jgi:alpha-beta hydrolase superfamily lysophospholipase
LFVHGAWHARWGEYFMPHFSESGFARATFDLRGHAENEERENLHEYRLLNRLPNHG